MKFEHLPACSDHFAVLNGSRAWSEFGWAISYDPHGSVHTYLGGTVDCNSTYDEVMAISGIKAHADRAQRVYLSNMLRSYVFYALKVRSDAGRETTPESRARDTSPTPPLSSSEMGLTRVARARARRLPVGLDVLSRRRTSTATGSSRCRATARSTRPSRSATPTATTCPR